MNLFEDYAFSLAAAAQKAVLYEAVTAPKPGLVDRLGQGAHKDMDIFTFAASSSAIYRGMYGCAFAGISGQEDGQRLLEKIRPIGMECETAMLKATNGVNTHKGIIFSMGILCAAMGSIYRNGQRDMASAEQVCEKAAGMCQGLVEQDLGKVKNKGKLTHGEKLYIDYGITGIRGEAQGGFKTVLEKGIPILRSKAMREKLGLNDLLLHTLMSIMTCCQDTNVIIRGGMEGLRLVKESAEEFMASGGMLSPNAKDRLHRLDSLFIEKNISPGGSADLLSLSLFLADMEGIRL